MRIPPAFSFAFIAILAVPLAAQFEVYRNLDAPPIIFPPGDYGRAVCGVGDLDQDGFPDYAVGTPTAVLNQGQVRAFSGKTNAQLWSTTGGDFNASFGFDLAAIGDVNSDGVPDVIVGDPLNDVGPGSDAGRVVVLSGADGSFIFELFGDQAGARFGWSVASAGDATNDGVDDLLVGAPRYDGVGVNSGQVRLYNGSTQGFAFSFSSGSSFDQLGYDVAGNFDFDGDGYSEIAMGAPFADPNGSQSGEVRILTFIQVFGFITIGEIATLEGVSIGDRFGWSLASFEDLTGDGIGDLAVGSPNEQNGLASLAGHVRLFAGPNVSAVMDIVGGPSDRLGYSVANAGDIDGDGVVDIVVGAINASMTAADEGAVRVFSGSDGLLIASRFGDPAGGDYGTSVAGVGDLDGDGVQEIIVGDLANQNVQVLNLPLAYTGSLEDIRMETGIDAEPLSQWPDRKHAPAGSLVTFRLRSPEGSYDGMIPVTVGQLFPTLSPPLSPGGFPEIHVRPSQAFIIYDGNDAPVLGPAVLTALGLTSSFIVPVGLGGTSLMIQGLSLSPSAQQMNNFFTATNGQEIVF
ncbi:MAG: integrin alpha [Planctomycetota bacterium]